MKLAVPGKVFLAGEYAVLEREPALVVGIDRALSGEFRPLLRGELELRHAPSNASLSGVIRDGAAQWQGGVPGELRFAARAAQVAVEFCAGKGLPPSGLALTFLDDFAHQGRKLGLGGSAAASVLAVHAVCAAHGSPVTAREALALALAAHRAEQGGAGSGADVAACALGGLVEVRVRPPAASLAAPSTAPVDPDPLEVRRVAAPPDLRLLLAFAGSSADTRKLVAEVRSFAAAAPTRFRSHVAALAKSSASLRDALEGSLREAALDAVRSAAAAMAALGAEAGVAIVTPALARACALASSAGAAAKPSGAGGGDCAVVLAFGDEARDQAERALAPEFFTLRIAPSEPS